MVALKIEDIREFTKKLFIGEAFDTFLLREATVVTFNAFSIDGHIRQGYYTEQELEEEGIGELSSWAVIKPICFSLIKGKKLPGSFQITLQLSPEQAERFLAHSQVGLTVDQVNGIYINIRYEDNALYCVSGTSLNTFTLDRSLDREWDEALRLFLRQNEIACSEEKG